MEMWLVMSLKIKVNVVEIEYWESVVWLRDFDLSFLP